jgi:DNA polymerase V
MQLPLFDKVDRQKAMRLMQAVDKIKATFSDANTRWAAEGLAQPWLNHFKKRSRRFTTKWNELPEVA